MRRLDASGKWRVEQTLSLKTDCGKQLFMRQFNPYDPDKLEPKPESEPTAVVMIVHGINDQGDSEPILTAAKKLSGENYLVYSVDVRGCGRSEGPRMVMRDFHDFVSDHDKLLDAILAKHPGKKVFVLGVSLGGGFTVFLALKRKEISGMLLIAPMIQISSEQSPIMQKLSPIIAAIAPDSKVGKHQRSLDGTNFSDHCILHPSFITSGCVVSMFPLGLNVSTLNASTDMNCIDCVF